MVDSSTRDFVPQAAAPGAGGTAPAPSAPPAPIAPAALPAVAPCGPRRPRRHDTALRELLPALAWGGQALVQPFSAYWFITSLFCSCLLYAAADRSGPVARWSLFVTGAALTVYASEQLAGLPLSAGTAVPAVVFIEAGRQLHRRERWLQGRATVMAAVLVVVLAAIAVAAGRLPRVDLKAGDFGVPVLSAMLGVALSVALLVLARAVCRPLGERAGRAVTTMATAVVPVVLLHPLALEVPAGGGWRPAYFAAGLPIPLGLAQAVARTRLSGWMLGHRHHTAPGPAASRHADLSSRPTCRMWPRSSERHGSPAQQLELRGRGVPGGRGEPQKALAAVLTEQAQTVDLDGPEFRMDQPLAVRTPNSHLLILPEPGELVAGRTQPRNQLDNLGILATPSGDRP